jgi:hypothetical protein
MTAYTLICGTPGVHLKDSCRRIGQRSERVYGSVSHAHTDDRAEVNVREYVQFPRARASQIWNDAVVKSITALNPRAAVRFISVHLTLYERSKNVFFSPARLSSLSPDAWSPSSVVLLIDDIFDMHKRLAERTAIFSEKRISEEVAQDTAEAAWPAQAAERNFMDKESQLFRIEARVAILNLLLSWRRHEMVIAENIASQLNVPLYLIGVKHPISLFDLIVDPHRSPLTCYISHPITSVRRGVVENTDDWPEYAHNLNELPSRLKDNEIVGIMPTAIDELRFGLPDTAEPAGSASAKCGDIHLVNIFTSGLRPRWPVIKQERIIEEAPATDADSGFGTDMLNVHKSYVSGLLRGLWLTIANEVPFRDHYLVVNTPHFLAFRPREGGEDFSRGVKFEINHFDRLADLDEARRMCIVHDIDDVKKLKGDLEKESHSYPLGLESLLTAVQERAGELGIHDLSDSNATAILQRRSVPSGLLGRLHGREEELLDARDQILARHAKFVLYQELTTFKKNRKWCRVLISDLAIDDWMEGVAEWFRGLQTKVHDEFIVEGIEHVMPDEELVGWVEKIYRWRQA